jgi:nucleoside-diphosphate-sugar epimerase
MTKRYPRESEKTLGNGSKENLEEPMKALVTGATGFIGSHLAELLLSQGWELVCPVRDPSHIKHLDGLPVRIIPLDALADEIAQHPDFDYVFHVAAATRAVSSEAYHKANVDFTRLLLEQLSRARPIESLKRFVLVSSQAVSGPSPDNGTPVDEAHPLAPLSMYGRSKLEAERAVLGFRESVPVTIVRPPTVFGPRDTDVLGVFKCARFRLAPRIGGPDRLVSIIYVKDLVSGFLAAAISPAAEGKIYFMANPEPVVWKEFTLEVARIMGYRALSLPVPVNIMKLVALAGEVVGRVRSDPALFRMEKFSEMKQLAWVCSPEKAFRELGWRAETPLEQAIQETARWYRSNGWV